MTDQNRTEFLKRCFGDDMPEQGTEGYRYAERLYDAYEKLPADEKAIVAKVYFMRDQ